RHLMFFFQAEDGIRDRNVTGVQTCALPIFLTSFSDRRDRNLFPNVYADANAGADTGAQPQFPKATGPIRYIGQKAVAQDIANLRSEERRVGQEERPAGRANR